MDDVRLIDANALQRAFDKAHEGDPDFYCDNFLNNAGNPSTEWDCVDDILQSAPTIEAQPVKRGKWVDVDYKTMEHGFIETYPNEGICCSECRTGFKKSRLLVREYCPACGSHNGGGE